MKKRTEFEVVPLREVLQKARPVEEADPGEESLAALPPRKGRLIENAPFNASKNGGK